MDADRLARRFARQEEFAHGYAPLYARLFGLVARWLQSPGRESDPLVAWLLSAAAGQQSLVVTNLLLAGLHRLVLSGADDVAALAAYFPTASGTKLPLDDDLPAIFRTAILRHRHELADFIQHSTVQTNETARGLVWVLPLSFVPWPTVHLVDLGASAGLNLVADHRVYSLSLPGGEQVTLPPATRPVQFHTHVQGDTTPLSYATALPTITRRDGCDLNPFPLDTPADELTLMSFIWADQPHRLARLREGISAYHQVQASAVPVHLTKANMPPDLPAYLHQLEQTDPIMIYNTYLTAYLRDRGTTLPGIIGEWATSHNRPVLWAQWEPAYGETPPDTGWCAWTVDYWRGASHQHWQLGWVHPHGTEALLAPAFHAMVKFLRNAY